MSNKRPQIVNTKSDNVAGTFCCTGLTHNEIEKMRKRSVALYITLPSSQHFA